MGLTLLGVGTLHMLRSSALLVPLLLLLLLRLVVRSALDISACQTFSTASLLPLPLPLHLSASAFVCARWRTTFNPFSGVWHSGAIGMVIIFYCVRIIKLNKFVTLIGEVYS